MVVFDTIMLACAVHELDQRAMGARIERITQPTLLGTQWTLYSNGRKFTLFIETDSLSSRMHFTTMALPSPPTPPMFCMLLRKLLSGAYIASIEMPRGMGERIIKIDFINDNVRYSYYVELMGRHGNQCLVSESGLILGSIKRVTPEMSRVRQVRTGLAYSLPPVRLGAKRDAFAPVAGNALPVESFGSAKDAQDWVMRTFSGVSPLMANEAVHRRPAGSMTSETIWYGLNDLLNAARLSDYAPVVTTDNFGRITGAYPVVLRSVGPSNQATSPSFGEAVDDAAESVKRNFVLETERTSLLSALRRALRGLEKETLDIDEGLINSVRADEYKMCGELILANQKSIEPGAVEVDLPDYTTGDNIPIVLDPVLNTHQNAERYFKKYRKARDSRVRLVNRQSEIAERVGRIEQALPVIESTASIEALQELGRKLEDIRSSASGAKSEQAQVKQEPSPYAGYKVKIYHSVDGWEIIVGENSASNDFITTKVAKPSDIWLHARSQVSAHAIIKAKNRPAAVSSIAIRYAAEQVAKRSASKHSRLVPVDYTLRKYVHKPRGSAAGAVLYSREKTIDVTPDVEE